VPMLLMGDEFGRTQFGNNNAYCQDNEISWVDWSKMDNDLLRFTRKIIRLTRNHPTFNRRRWFQGQLIKGEGVTDIAWMLPDGTEMEQKHWEESHAKSLAMYLHGKGIRSLDPQGRQIVDDTFYVIFNAHYEQVMYTLPDEKYGSSWIKLLDTNEPDYENHSKVFEPGENLILEGRSVVVMCHRE
jgi:isoamylase